MEGREGIITGQVYFSLIEHKKLLKGLEIVCKPERLLFVVYLTSEFALGILNQSSPSHLRWVGHNPIRG
jgi:hypothetical protein